MKKALALLACLTVFCGAFFAEPLDNNDFMAMKKFEEEKLLTTKIVPEVQHCESDKNAKIWIEYSPAYHEAHIYYETSYFTYDKGQAMNTVLAIREDFMKEKNYKHFRYREDPKEKMVKGERGKSMQYIVYLQFEY